MYYFAYGSNMLRARLTQRVGTVSVVGAGRVSSYQLRFHKRSDDGSGKCNLYYTGNQFDRVHGAVYDLCLRQCIRLDGFEGRGYDAQTVIVQVGDQHVRALTYVGLPEFLQEGLAPYDWYHAFVLVGARQHGLDQRHINTIVKVPADPDPDIERATRNTLLLRRHQLTIL